MKRLLVFVLVFCLAPRFAYSQEAGSRIILETNSSPRNGFEIVEIEFGKDYGVQYSKIYDVAGLNYIDLMNAVEAMLNQLPNASEEKTSQDTAINRKDDSLKEIGSFHGRSGGVVLEPNNYGMKRSGQMMGVLAGPLNYEWSVDVKSGRYRVIIKRFWFSDSATSSFLGGSDYKDWVKSDGTWRTRSVFKNGLELLDSYFFEAFNLTSYKLDKDNDW
ncbi:hypothetical protein HQ496_01390 [bacterium]|nr:hypothetical protein [bacterium]